MSILTAIFQAIGQALAWVLPISESGHSAIFHDFAGRFTNACSQLTGVIHIGIAIGIFVAFFKLFVNLFKNFFGTWNEIFHKKLNIKSSSPSRVFMYMTILSFAFFLFYLIPAGKYDNVFMVFHSLSFDGNLLSEGIFFALTGGLLILASLLSNKSSGSKLPPFAQAIILGIAAFLSIPLAGTSPVVMIFTVAVLIGMTNKFALRYAMVISVPALIVSGIIELCTAVTAVSIASAIIGLIISAVIAFFAVKILIYVIKNKQLMLFAIYDIAIGVVTLVIGIIELVIK